MSKLLSDKLECFGKKMSPAVLKRRSQAADRFVKLGLILKAQHAFHFKSLSAHLVMNKLKVFGRKFNFIAR
jgi:hypothetical protein